MATSEAWTVATHIGESKLRLPTNPSPGANKIMITRNVGTDGVTNLGWGDTSGLVAPTSEGQVLQSQETSTAGTFEWVAKDSLNIDDTPLDDGSY